MTLFSLLNRLAFAFFPVLLFKVDSFWRVLSASLFRSLGASRGSHTFAQTQLSVFLPSKSLWQSKPLAIVFLLLLSGHDFLGVSLQQWIQTSYQNSKDLQLLKTGLVHQG